MNSELLFTLVYGGAGLLLVLIVILSRRAKRHGGSYRAGVVGAMYEWQNKDKQRALDTIVEGRAAETRPEYPDGDLPQLEEPNVASAASRGDDAPTDESQRGGCAGTKNVNGRGGRPTRG